METEQIAAALAWRCGPQRRRFPTCYLPEQPEHTAYRNMVSAGPTAVLKRKAARGCLIPPEARYGVGATLGCCWVKATLPGIELPFTALRIPLHRNKVMDWLWHISTLTAGCRLTARPSRGTQRHSKALALISGLLSVLVLSASCC
ncbi:WD repeat-containing protein 64 [Platysternon megacephalum]|uniref:WD repeat-containing protein 64 n=1 Tax=Platysternon megacephalum TaxID=55544 RepID=A0A4D9EFW7_9SAUR|nr:WD repeat-containing protein 64 [Platysternon megacephalum]